MSLSNVQNIIGADGDLLQQLGTYLFQFAEQSQDVFWIMSHDYKKQLYVSPAFETIWGRKREELYQNPEQWIEYLHPEGG